MPISKNLTPVPEASGLGDRKCMAFSATTVSAGQGLGVVVATGVVLSDNHWGRVLGVGLVLRV